MTVKVFPFTDLVSSSHCKKSSNSVDVDGVYKLKPNFAQTLKPKGI